MGLIAALIATALCCGLRLAKAEESGKDAAASADAGRP